MKKRTEIFIVKLNMFHSGVTARAFSSYQLAEKYAVGIANDFLSEEYGYNKNGKDFEPVATFADVLDYFGENSLFIDGFDISIEPTYLDEV